MGKEEAIKLMSSSKTISEWNLNRKTVLNSFEKENNLPSWFNIEIDGSGLCVRTLEPFKEKK